MVVDEKQLQQITVEPVQSKQVFLDWDTTGRITFDEDHLTPVATPYAGRIQELLAGKGDLVVKDQPLVKLESPDLVAVQADLTAARSDVAKAKIGLNIAESIAERTRDLYAHKATADKDLQQAEADLARAQDEEIRAQAALAAVESRIELFGKQPREIERQGAPVDRSIVIGLSVILLAGGLYAFKHLDIEAYPDPSPPTVEVIAQNSGWSAEEMERQITVPLETQLNGMPGLDHIRSISLFGLTDIKCYFTFETDYGAARQEVINRIQMVPLPQGVQPELSPWSAIAFPSGEIAANENCSRSKSISRCRLELASRTKVGEPAGEPTSITRICSRWVKPSNRIITTSRFLPCHRWKNDNSSSISFGLSIGIIDPRDKVSFNFITTMILQASHCTKKSRSARPANRVRERWKYG